MTIPASTVPAAIEAIKAATAAQMTDPSILLTVGDPGMDLPDNVIAIGEVRRTVEPATFIGNGGLFWLEEKYDIDVVCSAWSGSDNRTTITDMAWTLVNYVETAVRTDPSLGGIVNVAYPVGTHTLSATWTEDPDGMTIEIEMAIHVEALN